MFARIFLASALAGALWLLSAGAAWARVDVAFIRPEHFSEMPFSTAARDKVQQQLKDHFARLGARLPADQNLSIEITDLSLAGRLALGRARTSDVRVLRGGADWPRMHLRYRLESNGQLIRSGEDELADMSYLDGINPYAQDDNLRYEKKMIDDWFAGRFGSRTHPG